jgi:hypothetical protein
VFEFGEQCGIDQTFKDGVLHPLTVIFAHFGHFAQPFLPTGGGCINVIAN